MCTIAQAKTGRMNTSYMYTQVKNIPDPAANPVDPSDQKTIIPYYFISPARTYEVSV